MSAYYETPLNTGAFTDMLLARLTDAGLLVGDGLAPTAGGWSQGAPNVDSYAPYTVLAFSGAVQEYEGIGSSEWSATLSVRHYAGARKQADFQALRARTVIAQVQGEVFGDPAEKVVGVVGWRLGEMSRVDQADPPFWQVMDSVTITCSAI